ncbi:MAG: transcription elongation factor GreA [Clostridia bacterium]|nr:transcription elongation factor GreA [Clostridia bacterium]
MANKQQYTTKGFQELKDELERRKLHEREKIREDIAIAKGFGDLSENSEYDAARTAQAENEARIAELESLIENAIVVNDDQIDVNMISLGSTVVLHDDDCDEDDEDAIITYHIVGSNEADPLNNMISDQSPIGKAIMGKRAGEQVKVDAPSGELTFTIKEVTRHNHEI